MGLNIPNTCRVLSAMLLAGILAACEAPQRKSDFREAHALRVAQQNIELAINSRIEFSALSPAENAGFQKFVNAYHLRAAGPISVLMHTRSAAGGDADARVLAVRKLLNRAGVAAADINVLPLGTTGRRSASLVLAFKANTTVLPKCADWSSDPTYNWSNQSQSNFGCATQRNLGLTIADPGDLNKAATMSGSDAGRGERILNTYRSGDGGAGAAGGAAAP